MDLGKSEKSFRCRDSVQWPWIQGNNPVSKIALLAHCLPWKYSWDLVPGSQTDSSYSFVPVKLAKTFLTWGPIEIAWLALVNPGGWEITLGSDIKIMGPSHIIYSNVAWMTSNISVFLWEVQGKLIAARDFCLRPWVFPLPKRCPALWAGLMQL